MGKRNSNKTNYRDSESSSRTKFLSPSTGTFTSPIKATQPSTRAASSSPRSWLMFLPYAIAIFGVAFLVSAITASIVTPVQNSDATGGGTISLNTTAVNYYVNIASTGTVSKDIQTTYLGTRAAQVDNLDVRSNTPSGYKVYVSMANDTYGQTLPRYESGVYDRTKHLSAISGNGAVNTSTVASLSNPATLSTANTWGIAIPGNLATLNSNNHFVVPAGYSDQSVYTAASLDESARFAPVPAAGHEQLLYSYDASTVVSGAESDTSIATRHQVPVYYGFYATSALPSGTYKNTVRYTAYAEATSTEGGEAAAVGTLNYKTGGTINITTSLYTDRTIKANEVAVTITNGINDYSCAIANDAAISVEDPGRNDSVTIECAAPAVSRPGNYTVKVDIDGYAHHSQAPIFYDTDGMTTTISDVAKTIKTMQEVTTEACTNWTQAGKTIYAFENDAQAPIYKYTMGDITKTDGQLNLTDDWTTYNTASFASYGYIDNINTEVPETYLEDSRDRNYYRIRKLADGNCWMTENLRLVFDRDHVNSVGVLNSAGQIVAQNPVVKIDETNSNVGASATSAASSWTESTLADALAYTETWQVGPSYDITNRSKWGSDQQTEHPMTSGTSIQWSSEFSNYSMAYARSIYSNESVNPASIRARGCNNFGDVADSTKNACFILDNDDQQSGVYYNWRAATAGVARSDTANSPNDSICPKGWQLPNNSGNKSYHKLINETYGVGELTIGSTSNDIIDARNNGTDSDAGTHEAYQTLLGYHVWAMTAQVRMAPLSMPFAGYYYWGGSFSGVGTEGRWWTRTVRSAGDAYSFIGGAGQLYTQTSGHKGIGRSVRCVAQ